MSAIRNRWIRPAINLAVVVALLGALSYLPPDTSLADRQKTGVLKLCVPPRYPPLVTGDPQQPGFDIELAARLAERLGLRLAVNALSSIGTDFNPRNWSLTRAQCDIIAGGVADTVQTRSFLQTIPTPIESGWVGVSTTERLPAAGGAVTVLPGTSGLDRLALSGWLRQRGLRVIPARSPQHFVELLASGGAEAGITERFLTSTMALPAGARAFWLDPRFPPVRMALGLWKGDQTLKRAVAEALEAIGDTGELEALETRYHVESVEAAP
ncbi:substrate-binding periplasmic protein [Devosia sp. A16]|uniref:substrate-binding periplasmic protein n=1 Tax=Devosia sp. A16 TaxID=1736675 RepID=UPI0006D86289|nr:transporter substrate-binding domain-containing protein [Devosia sp. A16]